MVEVTMINNNFYDNNNYNNSHLIVQLNVFVDNVYIYIYI